MTRTDPRDHTLAAPGPDGGLVVLVQARHVDLTDTEHDDEQDDERGDDGAACWCDAGAMTGCWCDTWWVHLARPDGDVVVGPYEAERDALRALDHSRVVAALRTPGDAAALTHGEPEPGQGVVHPDGSAHTAAATDPACG